MSEERRVGKHERRINHQALAPGGQNGPDFNQEVNLHADTIAERHDAAGPAVAALDEEAERSAIRRANEILNGPAPAEVAEGAGLNPITNAPWDKWEIDLLIQHIQDPRNAPWLYGWSPMQVKLMLAGLASLRTAPAEVAEGEGEALNDLIRLLEQRYRDMGDTLARKAATALRAAPSLSRKEWGMLLEGINAAVKDGRDWNALRAKVREASKSRP